MVVIGAALAVMVMAQAFDLIAVMTQFGAVFISSVSPVNDEATDEPGSAEVHVETERRAVKARVCLRTPGEKLPAQIETRLVTGSA